MTDDYSPFTLPEYFVKMFLALKANEWVYEHELIGLALFSDDFLVFKEHSKGEDFKDLANYNTKVTWDESVGFGNCMITVRRLDGIEFSVLEKL